MKHISILDTTLRDGAQAAGISYSLTDKLAIIDALTQLDIDFIEAGNPGSNKNEQEFFEKVNKNSKTYKKLAAFGSSRRKDKKILEDSGISAIINAETSNVAIFGKAWDYHVTDVIRTSLEENLSMIYDTVKHLKDLNKYVIFDAEHFYDGFKNNKNYALEVLKTADKAGADILCLCDTNGGAMPGEITSITKKTAEMFPSKIGVHMHNDCGLAVANSIAAVEAGAVHVQGTIAGFGERCGNANLSSIIPALQLKLNYNCIPEENMDKLTQIVRMIAEISNFIIDDSMPYIGANAFTHKAGMHIDGVTKAKGSFEHMDPEKVGNERRFLISEIAGKSTIKEKLKAINKKFAEDSELVETITRDIKAGKGYMFEGADASFELYARKKAGISNNYFEVIDYKIIDEKTDNETDVSSSAVVRVKVGDRLEVAAACGDGPVNALDSALRKALEIFYPKVNKMRLTDYKVRVMDSTKATASNVRVLIESTDGHDYWTTAGVSANIIIASFKALKDSFIYKLMKDN